MVDAIHQRPEGTAGRTSRENRARFVEGEDYVELTSDEIRTMSIFPVRTARATLITRRGYLKLVKPLADDGAPQILRVRRPSGRTSGASQFGRSRRAQPPGCRVVSLVNRPPPCSGGACSGRARSENREESRPAPPI
ncbi:hypothetical protein [Ancylobacter sp.]|uniref:hypothetical protein n=1 Tax=Ancylobacter sp. TaxID=1872567 RepID=UPI003D0ED5A5